MRVWTFADPPDASESDVNMLACLVLWNEELRVKAQEGTMMPFEVGIFNGLQPRIWAAQMRAQLRVANGN